MPSHPCVRCSLTSEATLSLVALRFASEEARPVRTAYKAQAHSGFTGKLFISPNWLGEVGLIIPKVKATNALRGD